MKQYNAMTVIRQSSRTMLGEFFGHEKCLECLDFKKDKLYEIQTAFLALPDKILHHLEVIMRNVFNFANSNSTMVRLADEVKEFGAEDISKLEQLKSRYDKAFHIFLHHPEIWGKACTFAQADNLCNRYWTRCSALPQIVPLTSEAALETMGEKISAYFWQKQVRGKKFLVEYQKRTEHLHYYFIYLSDYANSYELWSENTNELECRNECRPINMVLAYDEQYGSLDTYNLGGGEVTAVLQRIFCETILQHTLVEKKTLKSAFSINQFLLRTNMLRAIPELGVKRAWISCLEFTYFGVDRRRSHRISTGNNVPDDEIYNIMEHDLNRGSVQESFTKVRFVRIMLDIELNGVMRKMCIELTRNSCTLKSNLEELRIIGEKFIKESGIDAQPDLF